MNKSIIERVLQEANYIMETKYTVRQIAKIFHVSKSTVHKDLKERLKYIDKGIHKKINKIFQEHIEIRHLRGGESTRKRYLKLKEG